MNKQEAVEHWTEFQCRISVGAYEERSSYHHESNTWPEDGVEESVANLETWAGSQGLEFCWNIDSKTWSLYPIEPTLVRCPYCQQLHESHLVERCPLKP